MERATWATSRIIFRKLDTEPGPKARMDWPPSPPPNSIRPQNKSGRSNPAGGEHARCGDGLEDAADQKSPDQNG
jgi:hypothetical protein